MGHEADGELAMTAPAEMPGVEEIARLLVSAHASLATPQNTARAILALFAPILAEKERLAGIADAYTACESVARKRVDHIEPSLEERLPALCEISRETWLAHKERAPIMAVDMLEHAKRKALEARALAAEAALAAERERCALIADDNADNDSRGDSPYDNGAGSCGYRKACYDIASAIRAEGE